MSGKGTAVGVAVGVTEGDGVGEGDAFCACATDAKHTNSRLTTANAARRESIVILSTKNLANSLCIWIIGNNPICRRVLRQQSDVSVECSDFMEIQRAVDRRDYEHKDDECGIWFHLNFELCERTQRSRFPGGKWLRCIKMLQSA